MQREIAEFLGKIKVKRAPAEVSASAIRPFADSPMRVLAELDILNACDRMRGYYLNIAETLAGGK